ncbi:discoidin domain-containing protein [Elusimicrobiota bacterium]
MYKLNSSKIIVLLFIVLFQQGCSIFKDNRGSSHIPDTSQSGKWKTIYYETFEKNSLFENWVPLSGLYSPENLKETPETFSGWEMKANALNGKTPEVIALRLKEKILGDQEITVDVSHNLLHRQLFISLCARSPEDGYCIQVQRKRIILSKYGLSNVISRVDFSKWPEIVEDDMKKVRIKAVREGSRISVFINEKKIMDYIDILPPLKTEYSSIYIGCISSIVNIKRIEVRTKQLEKKTSIQNELMEEFNSGHLMVFLDNYNRFKKMLSESERPAMELRVLQAAYAAGNYGMLINSAKHFSKLSDSLILFMNYAGTVKMEKKPDIPILKKLHLNSSSLLRKNLNIFLMCDFNDAVENNNIYRKKEYYGLISEEDKIDDEFRHFLMLSRVKESAVKGLKKESYKMLRNLVDSINPKHKIFAEVFLVWGDICRQFDDDSTYDKLLQYVDTNAKSIEGCRSWLYLKKAEWLLGEGRKKEGVLWLNKTIDEFSGELDPWLWANWVRAKVILSEGSIDKDKAILKDIAGKYEFYKKQSDVLEDIISKGENIKNRTEQEELIRKRTKVKSITVSSEEEGLDGPYALIDDSLKTRWGSEHNAEPQWIIFEFKERKKIGGIKIFWELAAARSYDILISDDGKKWKDIISKNDGIKGETNVFVFNHVETKYLQIYMKTRVTSWGYSIWEVVWF